MPPRERSGCGWRDRLVSREDASLSPAAWIHAVDIDGAKLHYHRWSTELYYILDGTGSVLLDEVEQPVAKGTLVHIPPGVVHGARGRMRILVVGVPDIAEDDNFEALERRILAPSGDRHRQVEHLGCTIGPLVLCTVLTLEPARS